MVGAAGEKPKTARQSRRQLSRAAFYINLWLGVITTVALITISITGILLNHKRALGLMPDVPHEPTAEFTASLPLERLAAAALEAAPQRARKDWKRGNAVDVSLIDRMDVRPRNGAGWRGIERDRSEIVRAWTVGHD